MKTLSGFLAVLFISIVSVVANAQQNDLSSRHQYVALPSDQGILVLASQPDSPLEFTNSELLVDVNGPSGLWVKAFGLRNRGTKPIRAYWVAAVGQEEWSWKAPDSSRFIMPGQMAEPLSKSKSEIVPLTKELREKLKLEGPMKGIVVFAVKRVEFADGSTFDQPGYASMLEYFEKFYNMSEPTDIDSK